MSVIFEFIIRNQISQFVIWMKTFKLLHIVFFSVIVVVESFHTLELVGVTELTVSFQTTSNGFNF